MTNAFLVFGIALLCGATLAADSAERPGWKLVFSDEFDKDGAPDLKKWKYEVGFLRNGEAQYYTNDRRENVRVEGGNLVIEGRKEEFKNPNFKEGAKGDWNQTKPSAEYTSGSVHTHSSFTFTYGRVDVRAKIPTGRGTWPAIWTLGANIHQVGWPKCGEIDILENVGYDPDGIHVNVHTEAYNHVKKTGKGKRVEVKRPFDDFHLYSIEWTDKKIDFLLDDKVIFTYENDGKKDVDTWPFDKPQYLILNFAIGGGWGGQKGIDDAIFPQKFLIDYVRIYQREEKK
ncbi:MAG TPA: glycoside hydrolase family 16 protein [Planctomycetota bacterium]|nr:glycoside hydrolase family 16 protein [Planctomycetota bacterium]